MTIDATAVAFSTSPDLVAGPYAVIETQVTFGKAARVGARAFIGAGARIGDRVSLGPGVIIQSTLAEPVHIENDVEIGAGAVITAGMRVGFRARIGAGCVVAENVPPNMVLAVQPAHVVGYRNGSHGPGAPLRSIRVDDIQEDRMDLGVSGAQVWRMREYRDYRGSLCVAELHRNELPFPPARMFLVYDVPSQNTRGDHAHRVCEQFMHCVSGSVSVVLDDGRDRVEVLLSKPWIGIYMPAMIWGTQYRYSPDAVLAVYASRPYENDDYLRDYSEFLKLVQKKK